MTQTKWPPAIPARFTIEAEQQAYASTQRSVFDEVQTGLTAIADQFEGGIPDGAVAEIAATANQQLAELKSLKERATAALNLNTASVQDLNTQLTGAIGNLNVAIGGLSASTLGEDQKGAGLLSAIYRGQTQEQGYAGQSTDLYGTQIDLNRLIDIVRAKGFSDQLGGGSLTRWLDADMARRDSIIKAAQLYNQAAQAGLIGKLGYQDGGIVGAFAGGGIVGNGLWGVDSVLAQYAGGGMIKLAGQEGILTAQATAAIGGAGAVDYINRYNALPVANDRYAAPNVATLSVPRAGASGDPSGLERLLGRAVSVLERIATLIEDGDADNVDATGEVADAITTLARQLGRSAGPVAVRRKANG